MKGHTLIALPLMLLLGACATAPVPCGTAQGTCPMQAIERAAAAAPYGVRGRYVLVVRRVGRAQGLVYLDSQRDYRDPRNVAVVIYRRAQAQLRARLGGDLARTLMGHRIAVIGRVRRVRVRFYDDAGHYSGKYYFQTHIDVGRGAQVLDLSARGTAPVSPAPTPAPPAPNG